MSEHHNTMKYGVGQKTLTSYLFGLGLSLVFTFLSFALVGKHLLAPVQTYIAIAILAIFQLVAQVVFFLRMNASKEGRWNLMPFLFTILVVGVLVFGSLWIMYNLNYNMVH